MKDTDILRKRQIITGSGASPAIVAEDLNWVAMVVEDQSEDLKVNHVLEIPAQAIFSHAIEGNAANAIFFSDCDAGGGLSCHDKVVIRRVMVDILKYLSLSYTVCMAVRHSSNLKDSLIGKTDLINEELFKDINNILDFFGSSHTIFTILNAQTILNSHSCADNIIYKEQHDPLYDPSCRCLSIVGAKIFVGEDVLHFALSWSERIYALYRKIAVVYFSANSNNSHLIFKDVLEYYKGRTIVADDRKQRVTEGHRNLARHRHMEHKPRPQ